MNWFRFYWPRAEMNMSCPQDFDAILTASYFGHSTSLRALLREDVRVESHVGTRGIYWASRMGHRDVIDLLLRKNYSPNVRVVDEQTGFIAAVQFNRLDVVKLLLEDEGFISEEDGYRVNSAAMRSRTPLSIAAGSGILAIVRQLLQHSQSSPV